MSTAVQQDPPDTNDEFLQALGDEIRKTIDERFAALPEPQTPVVNVAPAEVSVSVQPADNPAPIVNVTVPDQPAPTVNVETAPAIINVQTPAPVVNIEHRAADITVPPATVNVDMSQVVAVIKAGNDRAEERHVEGMAMMRELIDVLSKPKSLVMKDGKPVGLKVG